MYSLLSASADVIESGCVRGAGLDVGDGPTMKVLGEAMFLTNV